MRTMNEFSNNLMDVLSHIFSHEEGLANFGTGNIHLIFHAAKGGGEGVATFVTPVIKQQFCSGIIVCATIYCHINVSSYFDV